MTDALPFRADSRINGLLIAAGKKYADQKLGLCDAAGVLAAAAPEGVTGEESFYEHVHLNFTGIICSRGRGPGKFKRNWRAASATPRPPIGCRRHNVNACSG